MPLQTGDESQCVKISQISITSNVLLAIGPPVTRTRGIILTPDDQVQPDMHALTMVNNVIGVVNYVIAACSSLLNFMIADIIQPLRHRGW